MVQTQGFLEKCVLMISSDRGHVLEAWAISVLWLTDEDGNEYPELQVGAPSGALSHKLSGRRYTAENVTKSMKALMRKLVCLMQGLNDLPERHYVSLRLFYRDAVTPTDYEPSHFERAPSDGLSVAFESKPLQIDVGRVRTDHHIFQLHVLTREEFDDATEPEGLTACDGGFRLDLGASATCVPRPDDAVYDDDDDAGNGRLEVLIDKATKLIERVDDGTSITKEQLARPLGCDVVTAEVVLQNLEDDLCAAESSNPPPCATVHPCSQPLTSSHDYDASQTARPAHASYASQGDRVEAVASLATRLEARGRR